MPIPSARLTLRWQNCGQGHCHYRGINRWYFQLIHNWFRQYIKFIQRSIMMLWMVEDLHRLKQNYLQFGRPMWVSLISQGGCSGFRVTDCKGDNWEPLVTRPLADIRQAPRRPRLGTDKATEVIFRNWDQNHWGGNGNLSCLTWSLKPLEDCWGLSISRHCSCKTSFTASLTISERLFLDTIVPGFSPPRCSGIPTPQNGTCGGL